MKYRKLGKTDVDVSVICLGTMTFGRQNSEKEGHQQLDYALDHGVNFIDTAELYAVPSGKEYQGLTEKYIGTWLQNRKDRDKIVVATKVTGPSPNLKYISDNLGFTKPRILDAIDKSLTRLRTDYIDLYQFHWPERQTNYFGKLGYEHVESNMEVDNFMESLETVDGLIKEGKIKHFGISNETPWGFYKYLNLAEKHNLPRPQTVQNPYGLLTRMYEVGMSEMSIMEDCGLIAYSPLGFGRLTSKYITGDDNPNDRINQFTGFDRYNGDLSIEAAHKYYEIAKKYNLDMSQMALAFVNSRRFVTSTIIGATNMDQLKSNIESIDLVLSEDVIKEINEVHKLIPNPAP